ncbi:uncharacterized protein LOC108913444 isoform X2 [Anoplophora glabripennis]|uniref:uncharacterized protein LOC108913444 isoform X2 n=1 Tax=Anoplophora glabripennis TaxID=217634 RepID=UPI0008751CD4|nr:uncharacterized protein LOC108913444 isoform X2 [Anoplophora glabripennis]
MQNESKNCKDVFVTLILTESTSSLLNLNLPHLERIHPENSQICLITPSELNYFKKKYQKSKENLGQLDVASTSHGGDAGDKNIEEIYLKISSDMALFSNGNFSSSSCVDDEDGAKNMKEDQKPTNIFEATKIQKCPLVTARSRAHSDKLAVNSNDIYVSLLDTESQSSTDYICRICHGGESMDDLLTPCRCRGTIALVHLKCLERWLKESNHSHCELCQHHYQIIREPKYGVGWSILAFLRHPGPHLKDILLDFLAFALYTPSAVASTYMLMMICESLVKSNIVTNGTFSSHAIAFSAIFGMAAIDFTYTSWLMLTFQKHVENWRDWYRNSSTLKVVLPKIKLRPHKNKRKIVKFKTV